MTTRLIDPDTMQAIPDSDKGGFGCALEALCKVLGAKDCDIQHISTDWPPHELDIDGWVVLNDCESVAYIYKDRQWLALVDYAARGFWKATARLFDGRTLYSQGDNSEHIFDDWNEG